MELKELFFLLGKWAGSGKAEYPAIKDTGYSEVLFFEYDQTRDFIYYIQETKYSESSISGNTLHMESGYIKKADEGRIELSNSQNNGRVEVLTLKSVQNDTGIAKAVFVSKLFGNDPRMIRTEREYLVENGILRYEMKMATLKNNNLKTHLKAELKRES